MSVENNFLRFGKGLDKFVILTKIVSIQHIKYQEATLPPFDQNLRKGRKMMMMMMMMMMMKLGKTLFKYRYGKNC